MCMSSNTASCFWLRRSQKNTLPWPPAASSVSVTLRLNVNSLGRVTAAELARSSGDRNYDRTLLQTARGWEFRPARDPDGRAVAALFEVTFSF